MTSSRSASFLAPVLIGACALGYGLYHRDLLLTASGNQPGYWDIVLDVSSSVHFIAFGVLPVWLLAAYLHAAQVGRPAALMRYGSRRSLVAAATIGAAKLACLSILAANVGIGLSALGLPVEARMASIDTAMSAVYSKLGLPPILGWLAQSMLLIVFLVATQTISTIGTLAALRAGALVIVGQWLSFLVAVFGLFGDGVAAVARSIAILPELLSTPYGIGASIAAVLAIFLGPMVEAAVDRRSGAVAHA